jgi:hypothetical protein
MPSLPSAAREFGPPPHAWQSIDTAIERHIGLPIDAPIGFTIYRRSCPTQLLERAVEKAAVSRLCADCMAYRSPRCGRGSTNASRSRLSSSSNGGQTGISRHELRPDIYPREDAA